MERVTVDIKKLTSQSSHSISPTNSGNAPLRQALADRLGEIEAIEAIGKLLKAFPNGSPPDPKGYIGALAAILREYPRQVALRCADPIKGVSRETKFMPTVADLVAYCERETEAMRKPVDVEDHYAAIARQNRVRANDQDQWAEKRKMRPTYDELRAKYGPTWGIAQPCEEPATKAASARMLAEANERALLAEYQAAGLEPQRQPDGVLISLTLLRLVGGQGRNSKACNKKNDVSQSRLPSTEHHPTFPECETRP